MQRVSEDENLARIGGLPLDEAEAIAMSLADRDRLAVVAWAYEKLRDNRRQLGTYRSLLALLGFKGMTVADPYRVLMAAGALDLNNALPEEPRSDPSESRAASKRSSGSRRVHGPP